MSYNKLGKNYCLSNLSLSTFFYTRSNCNWYWSSSWTSNFGIFTSKNNLDLPGKEPIATNGRRVAHRRSYAVFVLTYVGLDWYFAVPISSCVCVFVMNEWFEFGVCCWCRWLECVDIHEIRNEKNTAIVIWNMQFFCHNIAVIEVIYAVFFLSNCRQEKALPFFPTEELTAKTGSTAISRASSRKLLEFTPTDFEQLN